jgi:hypothetical protein
MKIGLTDDVGLDRVTADAFRQLGNQIAAGFGQQHKADGSHSVITADGLVAGAMAIPVSAVQTMAQLTANTDNYVIPELTKKLIIKISTDAARNLTGLVAPTDRTRMPRLLLHNIGANNAVLVHDSANSFATNRFYGPGAANVTLNQFDSVWIHYDWTQFRWVIEGL